MPIENSAQKLEILQKIKSLEDVAERSMYHNIGSGIFNLIGTAVSVGILIENIKQEKNLKLVAEKLEKDQISVDEAIKEFDKSKKIMNGNRSWQFVGAATGLANNVWTALAAGVEGERLDDIEALKSLELFGQDNNNLLKELGGFIQRL